MNHIYRQLKSFVRAAALLAIVCLGAVQCDAQAAGRPQYVPNQLIIQMTAGATADQVAAAADKIGAKVVRKIALADTYLLELIPTRGMTVQTAGTRASAVPGVAKWSPNHLHYPCAVPNDALWNNLWGLRMINAPAAWNLQKGNASVIVAVNDSGVSTTHPDLQGRLLPGRDTADQDNDVTPSPTDEAAGHGTHVAGTIAAQGNNAIGVVGVCWDNVKILPIKIFPDAGGGAPTTAVVDGLDYAMTHGAKVVNMSYGSSYIFGGDAIEHAKLKELAAAGIILVAAAGNDSSPVGYPAAFPECIAVSALNRDEALTYYSCFGPEIDISAPGGEDTEDGPGAIWSTYYSKATGDMYRGWQGTSMAAPHVAGAAALLLSAGISPAKVADRLYKSARAPKLGALDRTKYGAGIVDLYAALNTPAEVEIVEPARGGAVWVGTPTFKIRTSMIVKESIRVYLDYTDANHDGIPDNPSQNIILDSVAMDNNPDKVSYDPASGMLEFKWPLLGQLPLEPGAHTIAVTADPNPDAVQAVAHDSMVFYVTPKTLPAGRHMISIPYPLDASVTPSTLFGNSNFSLARYISTSNTYVSYPSLEVWPTTNCGVRPEGATADTPPAGLGFWYENTVETPVVIDGTTDTQHSYTITLTRGLYGWNIIGTPFPFEVPWESVVVKYRGRMLPMMEAAAEGWIRPTIYSYDASSGYIPMMPPSAVLKPWEGYWVRILPAYTGREAEQITLIIPPLPLNNSSRQAGATKSSAVSADGWKLKIVAAAGNAVDTASVGTSSRAADGFDILDVEEPPVLDKYVDVSFVHSDWAGNSGRYATDFRNSVGTGKTWEFEVRTDMANKDITLRWPEISSIAKKYSVVLEDVDSSKRAYLPTTASYTFNSGSVPGVRRFKLEVKPAQRGAMLLSNVMVAKTRGSSVSVSYNVSRDARVEVRVKNAGNRVVRELVGNITRAAGLNVANWDGSLDNGNKAASGLYMVEIVATSVDGEVAKMIKPILMGR